MARTLGITAGVGEGQPNRPSDVMKVQMALNVAGLIVGMVDGVCGKNTKGGIRKFQQKYCSFAPDGSVLPGKKTDIALAAILASRGSQQILGMPELVRNSVMLSGVTAALREKVAQFAKAFGPITINSGRRDLSTQAALMAGMNDVQLGLYGDTDYIKEIKKLHPRTGNAVQLILQKYYKDGVDPHPFISRHLQGRAVDISMFAWSPADKKRAASIARSVGLTFKDETQQGILCFHIQF